MCVCVRSLICWRILSLFVGGGSISSWSAHKNVNCYFYFYRFFSCSLSCLFVLPPSLYTLLLLLFILRIFHLTHSYHHLFCHVDTLTTCHACLSMCVCLCVLLCVSPVYLMFICAHRTCHLYLFPRSLCHFD